MGFIVELVLLILFLSLLAQVPAWIWLVVITLIIIGYIKQ